MIILQDNILPALQSRVHYMHRYRL